MAIYGNPVGGALNAKTYQLEFNGNGSDKKEIVAVVVDEEEVFDATENDVRTGKVFATNTGIKTGTKNIPAYNTCEGYRLISPNSEFEIKLSLSNLYDYTKLQCIICPYNTSVSDSVSAEKIVLDNNVYQVGSSTVLSAVTKDTTNETINLGITNSSSIQYVIRFFTYKEDI